MNFRGHDIKDWSHYRTPRTISGFHPEEKAKVNVDKIVFWVSSIILVLMLIGAV